MLEQPYDCVGDPGLVVGLFAQLTHQRRHIADYGRADGPVAVLNDIAVRDERRTKASAVVVDVTGLSLLLALAEPAGGVPAGFPSRSWSGPASGRSDGRSLLQPPAGRLNVIFERVVLPAARDLVPGCDDRVLDARWPARSHLNPLSWAFGSLVLAPAIEGELDRELEHAPVARNNDPGVEVGGVVGDTPRQGQGIGVMARFAEQVSQPRPHVVRLGAHDGRHRRDAHFQGFHVRHCPSVASLAPATGAPPIQPVATSENRGMEVPDIRPTRGRWTWQPQPLRRCPAIDNRGFGRLWGPLRPPVTPCPTAPSRSPLIRVLRSTDADALWFDDHNTAAKRLEVVGIE